MLVSVKVLSHPGRLEVKQVELELTGLCDI